MKGKLEQMSSGILQVYVDTLVKKAYDNWMHVIEYDGKSLMSLNENKNIDSPQNDLLTGSQNHSNSFNHQLNMPSLSASISSEQPALDPGLNVRGKNIISIVLGMSFLSLHIWFISLLYYMVKYKALVCT